MFMNVWMYVCMSKRPSESISVAVCFHIFRSLGSDTLLPKHTLTDIKLFSGTYILFSFGIVRPFVCLACLLFFASSFFLLLCWIFNVCTFKLILKA